MPGRNASIVTLLLTRMVYSMNWYNLAPALNEIDTHYGVSLGQASLVFSLFLAGAGIFQVPAGIVAARIGAKANCMLGLLMMALTGIAEIFVNQFALFIALRFLSGIGAAFFFSSAVAVLNDIFPEKLSTYVGYYNAFFDIGGGTSILLFSVVTSTYGLQANELLMSGISFAAVLAIFLLIKKEAYQGNIDFSRLKKTVKRRNTWILAFGFSGFWASGYAFSEYMKNYASFTGLPLYYASALGSSVLFFGVLGSFVSGRVRAENHVRVAAVLVLFVTAALLWIPYFGVSGMWMASVVVGMLTVSISSMEYATVVFNERESRYVALNSGLFNSIQILIGSAIVGTFGFILDFGYEIAWIFLGIITSATLPLLLFYRASSGSDKQSTVT